MSAAMGGFVYERVMDAVDSAGVRHAFVVRIALPRRETPECDYESVKCDYEIRVAGLVETASISGSDEIDALAMTFEFIGARIRELRRQYVITWYGEPYTRLLNAGDPA